MLRGSSKRGYRTRSRKRRRYSGRRRSYRNYRRKYSRSSMDQRMRLIAVKNAVSSKRQYGWIARDLGRLVPDVLAVKLYAHFTNTQANINYYDSYVVLSPYRPFDGMNSVADYSDPTANCVGFDRLCGASGSTSMYKHYLPISVAVDYRTVVFPTQADNPAPDGKTGYERHYPPWSHRLRATTSETVENVPTTQVLWDQFLVQPGCSRQFTSGWSNSVYAATLGSNALYTSMPVQTCRWRTVHWNHRLLDVPFTQYVSGSSAYWAVYNAMPTVYSFVHYNGVAAGYQSGGTVASATKCRVFNDINLCVTVLFRTPHVAIT